MKIKRVNVDVQQGSSGVLSKHSQYIFDYHQSMPPQQLELGIAYPGLEAPFVANYLQPIFTMNFPEGYLAEKIRQRMAKTPYNDLYVLSLIGDNQIGRLSYSSPEVVRSKREAQIGLGEILKSQKPGEVFEELVDLYFASGVSGVQPKVLVPDRDQLDGDDYERKTFVSSDLIVKSGLMDYEGLAQNEFLCMEAARLSGIPTPDFYLSDNRELFVMKRFDLVGERKLGFEDISVLLDIPIDPTGNYKYTRNYKTVCEVISAVCPEDHTQAQRFFEYLCLSVMVRNGDAHLKNFGILYDHPGDQGSRRLSPIYDITCTSIYPSYDAKRLRNTYDTTMALPLMPGTKRDTSYPTRGSLLEFGRSVAMVSKPEAVIDRLADGMLKALSENRDRVESGLFDQMKAQWEQGMFVALNSSMPRRRSVKRQPPRVSSSDPEP